MRTELSSEVEAQRVGGEPLSGPYGAFRLHHPASGMLLNVMATDGRVDDSVPPDHPAFRWEHVSVSRDFPQGAVPTWEMMCWIRDLFFLPEEWVLQYHAPHAHHINIHPGVLHLWRPKLEAIPIPPPECV